MDTAKLSAGPCPVSHGLAKAGDTWSMLILRDAGLGHTRFDQFLKSLRIAPNILTRRLSALVEAGMLEKRQYSERPPRHEYVLTPAGRDYLPILHALAGWARKHGDAGAMSALVEMGSGRAIDPVVVDRHSWRPLTDLSISLKLPEKKGAA